MSLKPDAVCAKVIQVERPPDYAPLNQSLLSQDVESLAKAEASGDDKPYFEMFVQRSYPHIAAVIAQFESKHKKKLKKTVRKTL
jgi:annexin A7/11